MDETVLFGRYRLLTPAGSGGTAEVWRARDTRTGDEVALKRLHPIVFATAAGRRRLVREFEALRALDHPHVVRVRDLKIGRDDGAIILDYVDGPSLAARLAAGVPLGVDTAVRIASDVASALEAAHRAGIVHRDVTPGNVLIAPDGRARLTDFGIARSAPDRGAGGTETAVTATGLLVGTLRYIAPEQLRGESATDRSDLFSLAAVSYQMLAGRPPFAASTPVALVEEHATPPPPIDSVPPALDAAVRSGLAIDPAERPTSVAAFARALRAAADGTAVEATAAAAGNAAGEAAAGSHAAGITTPVLGAGSLPRPARSAGLAAIGLAALVGGAVVVGAMLDGTGGNAAGRDPATAAPSSPPAAESTPAPTAKDARSNDGAKENGKNKGGKEGKGKGKGGKGKDD